jgi:hypothetical protein
MKMTKNKNLNMADVSNFIREWYKSADERKRRKNKTNERLGQAFVNRFVLIGEGPLPDLFYEESPGQAEAKIWGYMAQVDNERMMGMGEGE